ncbi:isocitrate lyase/phosphoenolpyruvate mutase family protein [Roseomonas nepalensis]|uniref:Isocitrate lyase/phosphoenolpyruvate mutase family protein n=1 Tax=Muricoccus nepalensis TaxID=1854500 RepID=A0A502G517_9PROT|nr:isocitrate lyase/phosphoenolpyruvate mutase family protein [Roseomonas nepalensis]TPG56968.1 isocitrate lyase/phosphoenolpyruvate mutase family protein [Roseomonas nepalensis]
MIGARAERFRALHDAGCFALPNAWDAGSARLMAGLGFEAVATTSAGLAFHLGRRDGEAAVTRAEALGNARALIAAVDLPVSADLEDGFGPSPEEVAATVTAAAQAGLCGCTIEDTTADPARPIHDFDAAVARVAAAVQATRAAPHPFVLTARAENFLHGRPDLDDTLRRLAAFAEAGASCLYAPGLPDESAIRAVVRAVAPRPVNVLIGPRSGAVPLDRLAALGVRRVSVGGALARAAYGAALEAGRALARGDMAAIAALTPYGEIAPHMRSGERPT